MRTQQHWKDVFNVAITDTDVVLEILDARNPIGTHNHMIEDFLVKHRSGEIKLVLILNKIDMIPKNVASAWVQYYKMKNYTIFPVSARFKRGTNHLFHKIRILGKKEIVNALIVGYPNTGKSTFIETLTHNKKKVGTSAQAGFTRSIKKIKLTKNIFLIDTPGVIPIDETDETEIAIKACMTADKVEDPLAVVEAIFDLLSRKQFEELYHIELSENADADELVEKVGRKMGRLMAGGRVNEEEAQKTIIRDWQSNRLRYFMLPPNFNEKIDTIDGTAITDEDEQPDQNEEDE